MSLALSLSRSNLFGLTTLGAKVTLAGPSTLVPKEFSQMGAYVTHNLEEALLDADAVMLLRIQHERQSAKHFPSLLEYSKMFGLNKRVLNYMNKRSGYFTHAPLNRGVEIESELADSNRDVILNQVKNGIT